MDNNMIFTRKTLVDATHVDRWGRDAPGLSAGGDAGDGRGPCGPSGRGPGAAGSPGLFWAIVRQTIEIHRLPGIGETVLAETWPGPQPDGLSPVYGGPDAPGERSCSGRWRCGC
ncbi:MAG: hypothetical protein ACLSHU_00185 [Oscillospiraceae bacterium]